MTFDEAIKMIGKPIYTYEIYGGEYHVYKDRVFMVGKDFLYDDNEGYTKHGRTHEFCTFGRKWFDDKADCIKEAKKQLNKRAKTTNA